MDTEIIDKLFLELSHTRKIIKVNAKLEAKNKQLKEAIESYGNNPAGFDWGVLDKIDELETENEQLKQGIIDDRDVEVVLVPKELYDQLEAKIDGLKKAMALANSMILAGEKPSDKSKAIFDQALKGKPKIEGKE